MDLEDIKTSTGTRKVLVLARRSVESQGVHVASTNTLDCKYHSENSIYTRDDPAHMKGVLIENEPMLLYIVALPILCPVHSDLLQLRFPRPFLGHMLLTSSR